MRILLTGASGFVGGHFRAHLPALPLAGAGGERIDLRDEAAVRAAVETARPEAVVHLAARSHVPESVDNPREAITVNVVGTLNLLSALQDCGFRGRMVFVGSAEAYGAVSPEELPIVEERPLRPRNPYAASKAAAEALAYQWSQTAEFDIVMARPFNHIGPGQQPRFVVSDFGRQIAEIKLGRRPPVVRVGELEATRDFTDVRDTVRAYALLLKYGTNGEVYNVCSSQERSAGDLLGRLMEQGGVEAEVEAEETRKRPGEPRRFVGSFAKLERDTGWRPEISLETSLGDILRDWERRLT